jgi:hypothetical protein
MPSSSERGPGSQAAVRYIPCRVEPGMFRGEYLAHVEVGTLTDPEETVPAQLFVDQREVAGVRGTPARNNPVAAFLRVQLADRKGEHAVVVLPQPAEPVGATVTLDEGQLREEAPA